MPELVRKVDKHAPHRKCLTLAAASEAHTATSSSRRPGTQASTASHTSLLDNTPKLVQAIEHEQNLPEDAFQANVALHEIYFLRAEWSTVLAGLDRDIARYANSRSDMTPITRLAVIKSCYFLGVAREQSVSLESALLAYKQALPAIDHAPVNLAALPEYRTWASRLLGRICSLQSNQEDTTTLSAANTALISFRAWARLWDTDSAARTSSPSYSLGPFDISNKDVWAMYYHFLSFVLVSDLVYTTSADSPLALYSPEAPIKDLAKLRLRQRVELRQVETAYESLLLHKTKFPQASQSNQEVEDWANSVVSNWAIFCGPRWRDIDLGESGKAGIGRSTLDILYRAATKTFHSTPILRHLFSVHASLAEFDLAIKAFESYSDIIGRAKSRAEKSGHQEPGVDTDDVAVLTAAQAIGVLCRYGSQAEAEKALGVAKRLTGWLQQQRPTSSATFATSGTPEKAATEAVVSSSSRLAAHRAIGESCANWARLTHDPAQRSDFRERAIKSLRKAADLSPDGNLDLETALLLGTVLAENRQLVPASQIVKYALASSAEDEESQTRLLIPLYHLMSLLLTARGDYEHAVEFCNVAFEQFGGSDIMDGEPQSDALIMQMEESEKEAMLQLRLTQLALTELLDGSETAVDAGSQVLALYNRLFGTTGSGTAPPPKDTTPVLTSAASFAAPTLKSQGTFKSVGGSILRRSKSTRKGAEDPTPVPPLPSADNGANGTPISIQVTNEDGAPHEKHHRMHLPHHPLKHLGHHHHAADPEKDALQKQQPPPVPTKENASQPLGTVAHNINHSQQPHPLGHPSQPPTQDLRLPAPHPAPSTSSAPRPRYPSAQQKRHIVSLLVQIWLHIAGQYTRGEYFADADGAVEEAAKLVEGFQAEVAKEESSARAFDERGWGCGRSVNRLWADVWCEVSPMSNSCRSKKQQY